MTDILDFRVPMDFFPQYGDLHEPKVQNYLEVKLFSYSKDRVPQPGYQLASRFRRQNNQVAGFS